MNAQDILIRLVKADHITEEEFKLLYDKISVSNQIQIRPLEPSKKTPWPDIRFKSDEKIGIDFPKIHTSWLTHTDFQVTGSGFTSGPTISVSNGNQD